MTATREFSCIGPPGTGKTTWLSRQARLASDKYGGGGVVIASLTRAAATEIAGRETNVPDANVGTLHSHAFHALGRPKIVESSEGLKAWNEFVGGDRYLTIVDKRSIDPENAPLEATYAGSEGERLLNAMNVLRAQMRPEELWRSEVRRFAKRWQEFKDASGMLDFTDLIERAVEEIDQHSARPMAMLLDEAQDMSRLEMTLARKWGALCEVFVVVGDPDQNLYQWRGSDPEVFTEAEVSGTKVLEQSHRVPAAVHRYSVRWIEQIKDRPKVSYLPRDEEGEAIVRPHTWQYPEPLLRDILRDAEDGRSVMVLATCGYMLNPLVARMRDEGVPFHNPYRSIHGGWNPLRYAERVLAFLRPDPGTWAPDDRMWTWRDMQLWTEPLSAKDAMRRGAKSFIESKMLEDRFGEATNADVELSVPDVLELLKEDAASSAIDLDLNWLVSATRKSRRRIVEYPVAVAKKHGGRALHTSPKVIVGTIHSVKGGQADSVYVFPDLSLAGMDGWRRTGPSHDAIIRQFYVAFTRARKKLTLLSPHSSEYVPFLRP